MYSFNKKFVIILLLTQTYLTALRFNKIECNVLGNSSGTFQYCRVKPINRYLNMVHIRAYLPEAVTANITMHYQLMQRLSGWKPFLYDITVDVCKFLRRPNNAVIHILYDTIKNNTNLEKLKCPFQGLLALNVTNTESYEWMKALPFPSGEFAEFLTWSVNDIPKATVNVYWSL